MKQILSIFILALSVSLGACQSNNAKSAKAAEKQTAQSECTTSCSGSCGSCTATQSKSVVAKQSEEAGVYYFHGDRRCKTCKAVGAKAQEVAESLQVKFYDVNLDREENKELAKKFQASSSGLYILSSKSGDITDLTSFAFRNALNNTPAYIEKLQTVIKAEL